MRYLTTTLVFSLALFGCGEGHDHEDHDEGAHGEHAAPHGGELVELGEHAAHIEVKHDDGAGTVTVWLYDGDLKAMEPDEAPVLNFVSDAGPQSLTATKSDDAWVFAGEALKGDPAKARFQLKIGGKSYSPEFAH